MVTQHRGSARWLVNATSLLVETRPRWLRHAGSRYELEPVALAGVATCPRTCSCGGLSDLCHGHTSHARKKGGHKDPPHLVASVHSAWENVADQSGDWTRL